MPLRELMLWNCTSARNYQVLSEIKTLEILVLPDTYNGLPKKEIAAIESLRRHPSCAARG